MAQRLLCRFIILGQLAHSQSSDTIEPISNPKRWTRHVPALDGIRGVAILLVMAHNFNLLDGAEGTAGKATELLLNFGWVGVQLFFVLSGFLITNILLSTKHTNNYFRSFFGRRAVRIFPLYYVCLFLGLVAYPLVTGASVDGAENQIWLWTYLSNWTGPFGGGVGLYPHMWSLAIEEQFYLVWPLVVYFLGHRGLLRFCVALVVIALGARIGVRVLELPVEAAYQFTICRIDAIALGALAALAFRSNKTMAVVAGHRTSLRIAVAFGLVLTVIATNGAPRVGILSQTYGYTLFAILFAILVLDVAHSRGRKSDWLSRALGVSALRSAGTFSYAAYVFHKPLHALVGLPIANAMNGGEPASVLFSLAYFAVLSAAVFLLAFFSYHAFEKHVLELKRYFAAST